jgi:hypothetical protein
MQSESGCARHCSSSSFEPLIPAYKWRAKTISNPAPVRPAILDCSFNPLYRDGHLLHHRHSDHEIYTVSVFIRRVVHDIHDYEATVSSIQARLEHEFLFLDTFKQQFLDPNDGNLRKFKSLPDNLARNVCSILTGLNICLVEYRVVALKHGVDLTEAEELLELETNATSIISPSTAPVTNEDRARRFRDKVRALAATLRQKSLAPEWALFSKSKMEIMVNEYSQWTKRLR